MLRYCVYKITRCRVTIAGCENAFACWVNVGFFQEFSAVTGYGDCFTMFISLINEVNCVGAPKTVGLELFTNYILPFELVGILLLVALIGALVMGRQPEGAGEGIASLKASDR